MEHIDVKKPMIGIIVRCANQNGNFIIKGADGKEYFCPSFNDCGNENFYKHAKIGHYVAFEVKEYFNKTEENHYRDLAINVQRIGYGKRHKHMDVIKKVTAVVGTMQDTVTRDYYLKDLNELSEWLTHIPCVCMHCGNPIGELHISDGE